MVIVPLYHQHVSLDDSHFAPARSRRALRTPPVTPGLIPILAVVPVPVEEQHLTPLRGGEDLTYGNKGAIIGSKAKTQDTNTELRKRLQGRFLSSVGFGWFS